MFSTNRRPAYQLQIHQLGMVHIEQSCERQEEIVRWTLNFGISLDSVRWHAIRQAFRCLNSINGIPYETCVAV